MSKVPRTPIKPKLDVAKFSKMLVSHCRENKFPIPEADFLDYLDNVANGIVEEEEIPTATQLYCSDEELTQSQPTEDEESPVLLPLKKTIGKKLKSTKHWDKFKVKEEDK